MLSNQLQNLGQVIYSDGTKLGSYPQTKGTDLLLVVVYVGFMVTVMLATGPTHSRPVTGLPGLARLHWASTSSPTCNVEGLVGRPFLMEINGNCSKEVQIPI